MAKIISCKPIGKHPTRDLEVDHADHQFYLSNGVLTSNSHSVAYAFCSYQTAWLMTYFEPEWLCAYIESMIDDPDSRSQAISELKSFGYKIGKVDINKSSFKWIIGDDNKTFVPSFKTVKGVGDVAIEEIVRLRPYNDINDLLWNDDGSWKHSKFNKRVFDNLTKVEAFDSMNIAGQGCKFENYRQMNKCIIENVPLLKKKNGKETLEKLISDSNLEADWSTFEKIAMYKELMGEINVDLIISPEIQRNLAKKDVKCIDQHDEGKDVVWFIPVRAIKKTSKNGKEYLLLTVIDQSAKEHRIFIWGADDDSSIMMNTPYVAEVEKTGFGFSSRLTKMKQLT